MKKSEKDKNNQKYHEAIPVTQINAADAAAMDYFGASCSLSADGTVLAVGANFWEGTHVDQGCVYIYDWDGDPWIQRSQITAIDAGKYSYFGVSCSLSSDGTILAVGAIDWEGIYISQGCVYIFDWNGNSWIQRSQITAVDAAAMGYFGASCSLSGNGTVLTVGAIGWEGAYKSQGCVYVYDWDDGVWTQRGQITASDATASDKFGVSCSLSEDGSILAVGAYLWEETCANQGCVYVYDWNGSAWTQRGQITAADAAAYDYFGMSCSLSADGTVLTVGATGWKGTYVNQGCVYVYDWNGSTWTQRGQITASDATASNYFGRSCSLSEDGAALTVGATGWEETYLNQGCVYHYTI